MSDIEKRAGDISNPFNKPLYLRLIAKDLLTDASRC